MIDTFVSFKYYFNIYCYSWSIFHRAFASLAACYCCFSFHFSLPIPSFTRIHLSSVLFFALLCSLVSSFATCIINHIKFHIVFAHFLNFAEQVNFINFLTKLIYTHSLILTRTHEIERGKNSKRMNPIIIDLCMKNEKP